MNSKIAIFMGAKEEKWYTPSEVYPQTGIHFSFPEKEYPENQRYWGDYALKYDKDWNWLMKVVDQIEGLGYGTVIVNNDLWGMYMNISGEPPFEKIVIRGKNKMTVVYNAVLEFINYYNELK